MARKSKIIADKRPSDFEYALMSQHAYDRQETSAEFQELKAKGWKICIEQSNSASGYAGIVYKNKLTRNVVVAHRGTNNWKSFLEDFQGILLGGEGIGQRRDAFELVGKSIELLKSEKYNHISFTGHSLGAFLAELSILFIHHILPKNPDLTGKTIVYNSVTFESPGCISIWKYLQSNLKSCQIQPETQDIVGYVSYPNRINTFDAQTGSLYYIRPNVSSSVNLGIPGAYTKACHTMQNILSLFRKFEKENEVDRSFMLDWPIGLQYRIFRSNSHFKKCNKEVKIAKPGNDTEAIPDLLNNFVSNLHPENEKYGVRNWVKTKLSRDEKVNYELCDDLEYRCNEFVKNYQAHFVPGQDNLFNASTLPLKHFSLGMQNWLYEVTDGLKSKKELSTADLPNGFVEYLQNLSITEMPGSGLKLVKLETKNVLKFREYISEWLQDNPDKLIFKKDVHETMGQKIVNDMRNYSTKKDLQIVGEGSTVSGSGNIENCSVTNTRVNLGSGSADLSNLSNMIKLNQANSVQASIVGKNSLIDGRINHCSVTDMEINFK